MIDFNAYVGSPTRSGAWLQPRMGFCDVEQMHRGLIATAKANADTVCTITLDAFTRTNDFAAAGAAIARNHHLNGYPIVNHPAETTRAMIAQIAQDHGTPVQIRHGSPKPSKIFKRMVEVGANTTEGGPVSYCLPYSRVPLSEAFTDWAEACKTLSRGVAHSHVESFAGCMMGQMCDPAILVALNILEGLFLIEHGIETVSFSYSQGTSAVQDQAAVRALQMLARQFFDPGKYHIVAYVFMGYFPRTMAGFSRITADALQVVRATDIARVIVKTPVESSRIPTIAENIASLEYAQSSMDRCDGDLFPQDDIDEYERILSMATGLVKNVLSLDKDISVAILEAFKTGLLCVPYCLHPDNRLGSSTVLDDRNYARMADATKGESSSTFLANLRRNIQRYDRTSA